MEDEKQCQFNKNGSCIYYDTIISLLKKSEQLLTHLLQTSTLTIEQQAKILLAVENIKFCTEREY